MPTSVPSLTDRDLATLRMVYDYEGCVIEHIRQRFFPSPGARTPCYRRVSYLVNHGFLSSTRLPSLTGQGSGKMLLTIGPTARPILAEMLGLSRSELARSKMDSPVFIAHHLAICDARLAFELAVERSNFFRLQEWRGDRALHQSPLRVTDPKTNTVLPIIPDSSFTLVLANGDEQTFFLEMDMGTIAQKRMQAKLRAYLVRQGENIPVLFVVTNESRQVSITNWALFEGNTLNRDPTIFWITTKEAITPQTVLSEPVWKVIGGPEVSLESLAGESFDVPYPDGLTRPSSFGGQGGLSP